MAALTLPVFLALGALLGACSRGESTQSGARVATGPSQAYCKAFHDEIDRYAQEESARRQASGQPTSGNTTMSGTTGNENIALAIHLNDSANTTQGASAPPSSAETGDSEGTDESASAPEAPASDQGRKSVAAMEACQEQWQADRDAQRRAAPTTCAEITGNEACPEPKPFWETEGVMPVLAELKPKTLAEVEASILDVAGDPVSAELPPSRIGNVGGVGTEPGAPPSNSGSTTPSSPSGSAAKVQARCDGGDLKSAGAKLNCPSQTSAPQAPAQPPPAPPAGPAPTTN
jgi:hypothetical protein